MKYIIILSYFIIYCFKINGQIVFEHVYDSASSIQNPFNTRTNELRIFNFEVSGERFIKVNRLGKSISIYNNNHSLEKTIDCSSYPVDPSNPAKMGDVLYFSEKLFDLNDLIEFMYVIKINNGGYDSWYTGIYNENGNLIFSDTGAAVMVLHSPQEQFSIYNTSQGTKMILSYITGQAKVFSLPGTLSTAIAEANGQLMQAQGGQGQFSGLYPNPSSNSVTLQYQLPQGEPYGEIVLYNTQGAEVKRYKVDNTFNDILIDNTMLPAGTYFYQLQTAKGAVGTKKSVIVR